MVCHSQRFDVCAILFKSMFIELDLPWWSLQVYTIRLFSTFLPCTFLTFIIGIYQMFCVSFAILLLPLLNSVSVLKMGIFISKHFDIQLFSYCSFTEMMKAKGNKQYGPDLEKCLSKLLWYFCEILLFDERSLCYFSRV